MKQDFSITQVSLIKDPAIYFKFGVECSKAQIRGIHSHLCSADQVPSSFQTFLKWRVSVATLRN